MVRKYVKGFGRRPICDGEEAADAEHGLKLAGASTPDCVLLDYALPDTNSKRWSPCDSQTERCQSSAVLVDFVARRRVAGEGQFKR